MAGDTARLDGVAAGAICSSERDCAAMGRTVSLWHTPTGAPRDMSLGAAIACR